MSGKFQSIYVAVWTKNAFHPAGMIVFDKSTRISGFKYLQNYDGPPLDPINLDYKKAGTRVFQVDSRYNVEMMHRVFEEGLPGRWGMDVMTASHPELKKMTSAEKMHWFGNRTVGGISFRIADTQTGENPSKGLDLLEKIRKDSVEFYMRQLPSIKDNLWGICSHGGMRPKTSFVDEEGGQWLVKFNTPVDGYDSGVVEHGFAVMAKDCDIDVVETKIVSLGKGDNALFVRRFDREAATRAHQISMFAMMNETKIRQPNEADYQDVVDIVRKASCRPVEDTKELYRRMLYNVATNNTDDHAKNFAMILTDEGYRLSPSYDVNPNPHPYPHAMSICGQANPVLNEKSAMEFADKFGVHRFDAMEILDKTLTVTRDWQRRLSAVGVQPQDIDFLKRSFAHGVDRKILEVTSRPSSRMG